MSAPFSSFITTSIPVTEIPGKGAVIHWLQANVKWRDVNGATHETPSFGYLSDGYSVPQCMWSLVRGVSSMLPAYLHDYNSQLGTPKWQSDCDLYYGLLDVNSPMWTAIKVWAGLQIGGWVAYNKYARMRAKGADIIAMRTALTLEDAERKAMQKYI